MTGPCRCPACHRPEPCQCERRARVLSAMLILAIMLFTAGVLMYAARLPRPPAG
jgi:hypothetical protein